MRVIAGSAKSLPLKTPRQNTTRPTTDRIKETLFNIIAPYIPDCRFLDLFSGSGGIGIEALSRGAAEAVFVEQDRAALSVIRQNLRFTHLEERARVIGSDVLKAVLSLKDEKPFDIIFMDPPYDHALERRVLESLQNSSCVKEDTWIIVEASAETDFSSLESLRYQLIREHTYGSNRHVFVKKRFISVGETPASIGGETPLRQKRNLTCTEEQFIREASIPSLTDILTL